MRQFDAWLSERVSEEMVDSLAGLRIGTVVLSVLASVALRQVIRDRVLTFPTP